LRAAYILAIACLIIGGLAFASNVKAPLPPGIIAVEQIPDATVYSPHQVGRGPFKITGNDEVQEYDSIGAQFGYIYDTEISMTTSSFEHYDDQYWIPGPNEYFNFLSVQLMTVMGATLHGFPYDDGNPNCTLSYSLDGGVTWNDSPLIPKDSPNQTPYGEIFWNVTTDLNWTPELVTSPDTWVMLTTSQEAGQYYQVDYIGFYWLWNFTSTPPGGTEIEEEEEGGGGFFNGFGWEWVAGDNIIGLLGLCGFCGMIIAPAAVIHAMKKGTIENKFQGVVGAIALGLVCFGLFMVALGGWG